MLTDTQRAGIAFGGVLGAAALAYVLSGRLELRRRRRPLTLAENPWVTLKNRRRVLIADDGRIKRGLPDIFHDVHIRDLSGLSRSVRQLEREGAEEETRIAAGGRRARTFRTQAEAVRALLEANPHLVDLLERECSHDCRAYRLWIARGRRGRKPQWTAGDGRFDAVNERLELRGARKVASWLEAVYTTPPPSRRWADFPDRLAALEEATGLRLELPDRAEDIDRAADDVGAVRQRTDERIAAIVHLARTRRQASSSAEDAAGGVELEDAPF